MISIAALVASCAALKQPPSVEAPIAINIIIGVFQIILIEEDPLEDEPLNIAAPTA